LQGTLILFINWNLSIVCIELTIFEVLTDFASLDSIDLLIFCHHLVAAACYYRLFLSWFYIRVVDVGTRNSIGWCNGRQWNGQHVTIHEISRTAESE